MRIKVADAFVLDGSRRQVTGEGFLRVPGKICAAGNVQTYHPRELGMDGSKPIRLYRPIEEVHKSAATFDGKPITLNHPKEGLVTASNWKALSRGTARDVRTLDDGLEADLHVNDKFAIDAINSGKVQLSNGYTFEPVMTPGVSPKGEAYDGIQTNLEGNHIAIVDTARGGPECRVADSEGDKKMALRRIVFDTLAVSLELEEPIASNVEEAIKKALAVADAACAERDTVVTECAETITALKEKHTEELKAVQDSIPELVEKATAERSAVLSAISTHNLPVKVEAKDTATLRRDVVNALGVKFASAKRVCDAVLGKTAVKDAAEDLVQQAFVASLASIDTKVRGENKLGKALAGDSDDTDANGKEEKLTGREAMLERSKNAFRREKK